MMAEDEATLSDTLLVLSSADNVALLRRPHPAGTQLRIDGRDITLARTLGMGHKIAIRPIAKGQDVLKYGAPIGFAGQPIEVGDHVHLHNLVSRYTVIQDMDKADE